MFIAFGNAEDDVIVGGGGMNLLFGNAGNDQFFGGGGVNIEFGNRDNDIMRGGGSADFLFGNRGNDTLAGAGAKDFMFGNRDDDCLSSDDGADFLFGNRGNDQVRSGNDSSSPNCDRLFGNRGNDNLYRCQTCDKRYGGRGNDSKHDDCAGCSLPAPARGEVRGRIMIDLDGDTVGDIPHAGVTVTCGSGSAVTDANGRYRIAGLAPGSYSAGESVPAGYTQVSSPATYPIAIGAMGIDIYLDRDFVNQEACYISPDAWECLGSGCAPPEPGCKPVAVRRVMRCADTGEICDSGADCPCSDCVPSWAVVECECNPECYIILDPVTGPQCSNCIGGGAVQPCELVETDGVFRCVCPQPILGACCDPISQICTLTTQADCIGEWQGADTTCDPNPCFQETGACCLLAVGICMETTQAECQGEWQGAGTTCNPDPCTSTGCPSDTSYFFFSGTVTSTFNLAVAPPPWNTIPVGTTWGAAYWFVRSSPDQDPDPSRGEYRGMLYYQIQVGPASSSGVLTPTTGRIVNYSMFTGFDGYDGQWNVPDANGRVLIELRDFTQQAWTLAGLNPRDGLPLCPAMGLNLFDRRVFHMDNLPNTETWNIVGTVDGFECHDCWEGPIPQSVVHPPAPKPLGQALERPALKPAAEPSSKLQKRP